MKPNYTQMCSSIDFFVFSCIDSIFNIGHKTKYQLWSYSQGRWISHYCIYVYNDTRADNDSTIEDLCLNIEIISIYNSLWNIVSTWENFLVILIVQYVRNHITSEIIIQIKKRVVEGLTITWPWLNTNILAWLKDTIHT